MFTEGDCTLRVISQYKPWCQSDDLGKLVFPEPFSPSEPDMDLLIIVDL